MTVLGTNNLTLKDWAVRRDPTGKTVAPDIVEFMAQENPIVQDMIFIEANNTTGHKTTARTGLPNVEFRIINKGVLASKSTTAQYVETIGTMETRSETDELLMEQERDGAALRASEDKAFIQSLGITAADYVFYGNSNSEPETFMGLSPRYNTLDRDIAPQAINTFDGKGVASANTSVWLVTWGDRTIHGIFPRGEDMGLQVKDRGVIPVTDADSRQFYAYSTTFRWNMGLAVPDWRYICRVANIDVNLLTFNAETGANLINLMIEASERVEGKNARTAFYVSRAVRKFLRFQILNKFNVNLTFDNVAGKRVMLFDEIPVKLCDSIMETESAIAPAP